MGGKESKQGNSKDNQDLEPKINHPRFKGAKISPGEGQETFLDIKIPIVNQKQYKQWETALKAGPQDKQPFLLPLKHSLKKQGLCGSSGFADVRYDGYPFMLSDQIKNRRNLNAKYFQEPELWYLVYVLILAGNQFHGDGKKVGDIRPENVFINSDGQVKVASHLTWPSQSNNYHKTFYEKQTTYLAPQQLKDIQFAKLQPSCDFKLAQSFSVGLTCLDAATLTSSNDMYLKGSKFAYEELQRKKSQIKYSQLLNLVIKNLCEVEPSNRSTCTELYLWLKPYQEDIINLQAFEVQRLPEKIQASSTNFQQGQSANFQEQQQWNSINKVHNTPPQGYASPPQGPTYARSYVVNHHGYPIQSSSQVQPGQPGQPQHQHQHQYQQHQHQHQHYQHPPPPPPLPPQNGQVTYHRFPSPGYAPVQSHFIKPLNLDEQQQAQKEQSLKKQQTFTYTQQNGANPQQTYVSHTYQNNSSPGQGKIQYESSGSKSNMQMTLEKIDEQLQMSRKMFPS